MAQQQRSQGPSDPEASGGGMSDAPELWGNGGLVGDRGIEQRFGAPELSVRVAPGAPERSALLARMLERGTPAQMPPLASEHIDPGGIAAVREWIAALEPQKAGPSP